MAYSEERKEKVFNKIIDAIADEGKPVREILKGKGFPSTSTFFEWLEEDISKSKRYARACQIRADVLFDEMLTIAFTPEIGETIKMVQKGTKKEMEKKKGDMLGHRRLKVDAIKWALSKMAPKKYGDKIDVTSNGDKITGDKIIIQGQKYAGKNSTNDSAD